MSRRRHTMVRAVRSRRAVGALLVVVTLLAGCGGGEGDGESGGEGDNSGRPDDQAGGWSYTDGSGETTALDEVPSRIVAHGSSAAALLSFGIRPVGIYADTNVEDDLALKDLDLEGIEIVGEEWGVINLEAVAALEPDLVVAEWWPIERAYSGMEEGTNATRETMEEIAPVVGVSQGPSIVEMIEDYAELAESLGADLDDPEVADSRTRFDDAVAAFEAAVETKPDLSVLAVSPTPESLYIAVPEYSAELSDFVEWGLDVVVPEHPDPGFEYWETLSWENADTYQADLLIIDQRSYPSNLEDAEGQPTWRSLAAADTDAVAVWPAFWLRTYDDYAGALEELTDAVEEADEDLVG
jgi:iron complex transport system substrate-binding protein